MYLKTNIEFLTALGIALENRKKIEVKENFARTCIE